MNILEFLAKHKLPSGVMEKKDNEEHWTITGIDRMPISALNELGKIKGFKQIIPFKRYPEETYDKIVIVIEDR